MRAAADPRFCELVGWGYWSARAGGPLVVGLGNSWVRLPRWVCWPQARPLTPPPLVPLLPAGRPGPCWRLGCAGSAAAAFPRSPFLQPQAQVPVSSGGWGGILEGLGGAGDRLPRERWGGSPLPNPRPLSSGPQNPFYPPGTLMLIPTPGNGALTPGCLLPIPAAWPRKGKATS